MVFSNDLILFLLTFGGKMLFSLFSAYSCISYFIDDLHFALYTLFFQQRNSFVKAYMDGTYLSLKNDSTFMIEIPFDEDRGFFQPSIGLKCGKTISKLLEGDI